MVKDQMACCCCVPLGMALHIVAGLDIIFMIFLITQGFDYLYSIERQDVPVLKQHYLMMTVVCFASVLLYSIPRTIMYFFMVGREKSYERMTLYFRTRIVTLIALCLILCSCFIMILVNAEALAYKDAYDLTKTLVILMAVTVFLTWTGIDLYWSIAIRTYKDTKKGKKAEEIAESLSNTKGPNKLLLENVKTTRYNNKFEV
jgi:hypothetical protein